MNLLNQSTNNITVPPPVSADFGDLKNGFSKSFFCVVICQHVDKLADAFEVTDGNIDDCFYLVPPDLLAR